jgi:adenylate cyclase
MTRFYLACICARRGRYEEARRLWEELIAINPAFSVEHYRRTLPYADPAIFDRVVEPLKDAGIAA